MNGNKMDNMKAVIFDQDNTLLDRTTTFRRFATLFLKVYFKHLDEDQEILDTIITLDQDGYKDKAELFSELLDMLPWRNKPRLGELMDFYAAEYVKSAVPMRRLNEVMTHLRIKYKVGLVTNGKTSIQYGKIDRLGIRSFFDTIIVSEEAGMKKPDPRIFEMAAARLSLSPEQCVFIGDHPVNDIEGAARVGMRTIWIKVNLPWPDGLTTVPTYTFRQLSELLKLF